MFENCGLKDSSFHVQKFIFSLWLQLNFGLSWFYWDAYLILYANLHQLKKLFKIFDLCTYTARHTDIQAFVSKFSS